MTKRFDYTPLQKSLQSLSKREKTVRKPYLSSSLFRFPFCRVHHHIKKITTPSKRHNPGRKRSWGQGTCRLAPAQIHSSLCPSTHTRLTFLRPLSCARPPSPQFSMPSSTRCRLHRKCLGHRRRRPSSGAIATKRSPAGRWASLRVILRQI